MPPKTISNEELAASLLGMIIELKAELITLRDLLAKQGVQIDHEELVALRKTKLLPALDELAESTGRTDSTVAETLRGIKASLEQSA